MSGEPTITINGTTLSLGQSMAVRVAVTVYLMEMSAPGALGDDHHGEAMARAYHERLLEVLRLMAA